MVLDAAIKVAEMSPSVRSLVNAARRKLNIRSLVGRLFPEFEPIEGEEEFLAEHGKALSWFLQNAGPGGVVESASYLLRKYREIGKSYGVFILLANDLGLVDINLTDRGEQLAEHYRESRDE